MSIKVYHHNCTINQIHMRNISSKVKLNSGGVVSVCPDLNVTSDFSHFSPCTAYLFLLRFVFSSGPNLSGTPHRGRLIALTAEK